MKEHGNSKGGFLFAALNLVTGVIVAAYTILRLMDKVSVLGRFSSFFEYMVIVIALSATTILILFSFSTYLKENKDAKKPQIQPEKQKESKLEVEEFQPVAKTPDEQVTKQSYEYSQELSLKRRDVLNSFKETKDRVMAEIQNQRKRANVNLFVGAFVTVAGLGVLFAFILISESDSAIKTMSFVDLSLYWLSKISLVILIETFAYFFLSVYKTALITIKYYQDELTGIESRKIALLFAILHDNHDDISSSLTVLNAIDRNYILHREQTTQELERIKIENTSMKEYSDRLFAILEKWNVK